MAELKVGTRQRGDVWIVDVQGTVDVTTSMALNQAIDKLFADGHSKLVVNMWHAEYINSSGWGILMAGLKRAMTAGGNVVLSELSDKIRGVYGTLDFRKWLKSYDRDADAVASFTA